MHRVVVTHPSASLYGSDRMLLESVRGLVAAGEAPLVLLGEDGPLLGAVRAAGATARVHPVPVLRKSALAPAGALRLLAGAAAATARGTLLLRRLRPDAVYVSTLTTPTWVLAARAAGAPVVCHVHEAESAAPRAVRRLLAAPLLASTALLVASRFAVDVLAGPWPALRARCRVVPNGVAGPPVPPAPPTGPRAGGPVRLLYVGRLSQRKGVLVALDAVAELRREGRDVRLDLVGSGHAEHTAFAAQLRERSRAAVADGALVLHGFAEDVWAHLADCDALLVPSVLPEPFGNTAVEGVLAQRPVVASDVGGLPEALAGTGARLVPPGDAPALAAALREVLDGEPRPADRARDAALLARRHAPERYREVVAASVRAAARPGRRARRGRRYSG